MLSCLISNSSPSQMAPGGQVGRKGAAWIPAGMKGTFLSRKCDWLLFNCCTQVGWTVCWLILAVLTGEYGHVTYGEGFSIEAPC